METSDSASQKSQHPQTLIPNPAAIIVPRRHGAVLIEPPAPQLATFLTTASTGKRRSGSISCISIDNLANLARRELTEAINRFASQTGFSPAPANAADRPWVVTGHQVELYHPGVWSKVILTDALAKSGGALAIDLLVDHDTVDHLGCSVPKWSGAQLEKKMVAWAEASALPAEFLSSPQGAEKSRWIRALQQFPLTQTDSLREFTQQWQRNSDRQYVSWMSRSRRLFEQSFGLDVQHVPCSYICSGVAWHGFVVLWLRHAHQWCKTYNTALMDYRLRHGITNPGRPMPNLAIAEKEIELPLWIYASGQPRQRLIVHNNGALYLMCADHRIDITDLQNGDVLQAGETLRQRLESAALHVRPRALTLTMFVRLLLSDLFIHGIGGALYDQMTDQIMSQLFGVCPAYACASAGWLLPIADEIHQTMTDISELKWRRHHMRSNPAQLVPQSHLTGQAIELSKQRLALVTGIHQSLVMDRQEHRRRGAHWLQRRKDFRQLRDINARLLALFEPQVREMESQIRQAELAQTNSAVACWREYFLALHPRWSLEKLIANIRSQVN